MRRSSAIVVGFLALALPLAAQTDLAPDELAQNRKLLQKYRQHPDQMARLRRDLQIFLTHEHREQITKLDRGLRAESPTTQARLLHVMDRYVDWLDNLDPAERQRVQAAPDKTKRLEIIRTLREGEWLRRQPRAVRDEIAKLDGDKRTARLRQLRDDERRRRQEWQIATRFWEDLVIRKTPQPAHLAAFPEDVQRYVQEWLRPLLTDEEKDRLQKAEGQWPLFPITLVELADRYPPALPGPRGPKSFKELPTDVRSRFKFISEDKLPKPLRLKQGQWPDFAKAVTEFTQTKLNVQLPPDFWPYNRRGLSGDVKAFLDKLIPELTPDEKLRLSNADGIWPDYPVAIEDAARNHNRRVPWQTLPGPRERWENFRFKRSG